MNAGFAEGMALSGTLRRVLREDAPLQDLSGVNQTWQAEWKQMLGLENPPRGSARTDPWVAAHATRLLSCLPAIGSDLTALAGQLALDWSPVTAETTAISGIK